MKGEKSILFDSIGKKREYACGILLIGYGKKDPMKVKFVILLAEIYDIIYKYFEYTWLPQEDGMYFRVKSRTYQQFLTWKLPKRQPKWNCGIYGVELPPPKGMKRERNQKGY